MEQWFSLMGIEDEEQIWNILEKNPYAMTKLKAIVDAGGGTMQLSDMLTEWELGIGALQSKIIRRVLQRIADQKKKGTNDDNKEASNEDNDKSANDDDKPKESAETEKPNASTDNDATANGAKKDDSKDDN